MPQPDLTPGYFIVFTIIALVVLYQVAKHWARRKEAERNKADGVTSYIGDLRMTSTELLIGEQRYPLTGLHATVEDSGTVNRRYTLTRMAMLGVAAVAVPKKLDDRDVYITVEGPGIAEVRVLHVKQTPNAGAIARQFAAKLNATAMQAGTTNEPRPTP